MLGRFPHAQLSACVRSKNKSASLSLSLPHSDLSFVESDSDGEWTETRRRPENGSTRPIRRKPPEEETEQGQGQEREERERNERALRIPFAAASGISFLLKTQACDLTMKLLWLSVFHSAASQPAKLFEFSTLMGPVVVPVCTLVTRSRSKSELPRQVHAAAEFVKGWRTPAMISILLRTLRGLAGQRPAMRNQNQDMILSQIQQGGQLREAVAAISPAIEELYRFACERSPSNTAGYVEIYKSVVHLFKCTLDWHPIESCRRFFLRFDDDSDTEVMRYLLASHLLEAKSDEDVERVFSQAGRRMQETLIWFNGYEFVRDAVLRRRWFDLVTWTKRLETGHPVMLIRLGEAIRVCQGDKADEYGRAIVTQVDRGVRKLLKNNNIDTLVALVDCEGASAVNVNRFYNLLRNVPITLNKHYPNRLKALYLVNVPTFVIWLVLLIKRFLHPVTREKIVVHGNNPSAWPEELVDIINWSNEHRNSATEGTSEVC